MKYDAAIFDMDGTVLDTIDDLTASLNHALAAEGMPAHARDEVFGFVGNGIRYLAECGVPEGTDADITDRVYRRLLEHYIEHCMDLTRPYPGIPGLLKALKDAGCRTAVVSNKNDAAVKRLTERYFSGLFAYSAGVSEGIRRKPAPDTVLAACRALAVEPGRCVYVGDSDVDLRTAANAGMPCISVLWGFRDRAFLTAHGAQRFAETPMDVCRMILD